MYPGDEIAPQSQAGAKYLSVTIAAMQGTFDRRHNNFDFIRLALAVLVIFSHSFPLATGTEDFEPFRLLTRGQVTSGAMAVDLFFIISGFLITASFERSRSVWEYLRKRVFRIYPGFILAACFGVFIALPASGGLLDGATLASRVAQFTSSTLQLHEFRYHGAFPANPYPRLINGSLWSISVEFWCYIGVAVLGVCGLLRSKRTLSLLFAVTVIMGVLYDIHRWTPAGGFLERVVGLPPFYPRLPPMYLAGALFYRLRDHLSLDRRWIAAALVLLCAAMWLPHGWQALFPFAGPYLVLAVAYHPAIRLHAWSKYGDFSYGTYLYAFPVQQLIMSRFGHKISPLLLFIIAAPSAVACAVLSWHLVERWFVKPKQRTEVAPAIAVPTAVQP